MDAPEGSVALRPPERLCRLGPLASRLALRASRSSLLAPRQALADASLPDREGVFVNELAQDPEQAAPFRLVAARLANLMIVEDLGELRQRSLGLIEELAGPIACAGADPAPAALAAERA